MKYNDKNTIYALFAYYVVAYANATCTGRLKIAAVAAQNSCLLYRKATSDLMATLKKLQNVTLNQV